MHIIIIGVGKDFSKMAEMNSNVNTSEDEQTSCVNIQPTQNCANCSLIEQQLQSALLELKSAQAVIALLSDDIKHHNLPTTTDTHSQELSMDSTMVNQDNQKWKTVTCNNSHTKNTPLQQLGKVKNSLYFKPLYAPT